MEIKGPISLGELIDKITILEIKKIVGYEKALHKKMFFKKFTLRCGGVV